MEWDFLLSLDKAGWSSVKLRELYFPNLSLLSFSPFCCVPVGPDSVQFRVVWRQCERETVRSLVWIVCPVEVAIAQQSSGPKGLQGFVCPCYSFYFTDTAGLIMLCPRGRLSPMWTWTKLWNILHFLQGLFTLSICFTAVFSLHLSNRPSLVKASKLLIDVSFSKTWSYLILRSDPSPMRRATGGMHLALAAGNKSWLFLTQLLQRSLNQH